MKKGKFVFETAKKSDLKMNGLLVYHSYVNFIDGDLINAITDKGNIKDFQKIFILSETGETYPLLELMDNYSAAVYKEGEPCVFEVVEFDGIIYANRVSKVFKGIMQVHLDVTVSTFDEVAPAEIAKDIVRHKLAEEKQVTVNSLNCL